MYNDIGKGLATILFIAMLLAFIVGSAIIGGIWFFTKKNYIESRTLITPEIQLTTDGKTVDTLYIYHKPTKK